MARLLTALKIPCWITPMICGNPQAFQSFTLSPGERAGVRASVNTTSFVNSSKYFIQTVYHVEMRVDAAPARDFTRRMKFVRYFAVLLATLSLTGCIFGKHRKSPPPPVVDLSAPTPIAPANTNTFRVTPDENVAGRVTYLDEKLRFVVLTFPLGQLPPAASRMNVFRNGAIVGEVKISREQRDDNTVADIVLGDARKGDEVRPK
jgi:hypothetical protein